MPVVSIVVGVLLVGLGLYGRFGTGTESNTALIPAGIGALLALLGALALKEAYLKHAMHGAAMVGLLGFLGGVANIFRVVTGGQTDRLRDFAGISTLLMTALCLLFVGLCVNSFVQVRRRRARDLAGGPPPV